jgi:hypothetical protein
VRFAGGWIAVLSLGLLALGTVRHVHVAIEAIVAGGVLWGAAVALKPSSHAVAVSAAAYAALLTVVSLTIGVGLLFIPAIWIIYPRPDGV